MTAPETTITKRAGRPDQQHVGVLLLHRRRHHRPRCRDHVPGRLHLRRRRDAAQRRRSSPPARRSPRAGPCPRARSCPAPRRRRWTTSAASTRAPTRCRSRSSRATSSRSTRCRPAPRPPPPDIDTPPDPGNWAECLSPVHYHGLELGDAPLRGAGDRPVRERAQPGRVAGRSTSGTSTSRVVDEGTCRRRSPPDTRIASGPADTDGSATDQTTEPATFTFAGSDNATPGLNLTFECSLDGAAFAPCTDAADAAPAWSLRPDPYVYQVRSIDKQGNVDPTPADHTWTIVLPPPPIPPDTTLTAMARPGDRAHRRDVHLHQRRPRSDLRVLARRGGMDGVRLAQAADAGWRPALASSASARCCPDDNWRPDAGALHLAGRVRARARHGLLRPDHHPEHQGQERPRPTASGTASSSAPTTSRSTSTATPSTARASAPASATTATTTSPSATARSASSTTASR